MRKTSQVIFPLVATPGGVGSLLTLHLPGVSFAYLKMTAWNMGKKIKRAF